MINLAGESIAGGRWTAARKIAAALNARSLDISGHIDALHVERRTAEVIKKVAEIPLAKSGWFGWAQDEKMQAIRNEFMRATDDATKKKLADQLHARAFEVGTHAPLGEYDQPTAATKNISGWFVTNGNLYWNLKKNGPQ